MTLLWNTVRTASRDHLWDAASRINKSRLFLSVRHFNSALQSQFALPSFLPSHPPFCNHKTYPQAALSLFPTWNRSMVQASNREPVFKHTDGMLSFVWPLYSPLILSAKGSPCHQKSHSGLYEISDGTGCGCSCSSWALVDMCLSFSETSRSCGFAADVLYNVMLVCTLCVSMRAV